MSRRAFLRAAAHVHALLAGAYPRAFRARFGADMQAVFESRIAAAMDRGAMRALACLIFAAADVIGGGMLERFAPTQQRTSARSFVMTWDAIRHDIRIAFRTMRRSPLFTALAVTALALGIGATGAIFAVVNGILLRPLPYRNADQLVMLWSNNTHTASSRNPISPANFLDAQRLNQSFTEVEALTSFLVNEQYRDSAPGATTEIAQMSTISAGMFALLGRDAELGRTFSPNEPAVVVLSHRFWQRRYAGDRGVIGRPVTLGGGAKATIIGVMPSDFVFPYKSMLGPSGFSTGATADIWEPMPWRTDRYVDSSGRPVRGVHFLGGVARLKPGVTAAGAARDLETIAAQLAAAYPETNAGWKMTVVPLADQTVGSLRPALMLLVAGVGVILLLVCANVANLVLSRSVARQRELAVRAALGAARAQLIRQSLIESLALSSVSGVASVAVFAASLKMLRLLAPADIARMNEVTSTPLVIGVMAALVVLTGLAVAVLPAIGHSRIDPQVALREGGRSSTSGRGGRRARAGLVIVELALAMILTAGAGLLIRSFVSVLHVNPGFAPEHVLTVKTEAPGRIGSQPALIAFYDELFARLEHLPGVTSAGGTTRIPLGSTNVSTRLEIQGVSVPVAELPEVEMRRAVHHYFSAMGIPVVRGRDFSTDDTLGSPRVSIVNETLARQLFPNGDAVGQRVRMGPAAPETPWSTIVGVIGDIRHSSLEQPPLPEFYIPARQGAPFSPVLTIRMTGDPAAMADAVRAELRRFDPTLLVYDIKPLETIRDDSVSQRRFLLTLVTAFGALALVLAAIGVYGVMAVAVSERRAEMGVRMALGASAGDILRLVLGDAARLATAGVGLGLVGALLLAPLLAHQLFGVTARDAATFVAVPLLLVAVAIAATLGPARRAMRVDPTKMLRGEL